MIFRKNKLLPALLILSLSVAVLDSRAFGAGRTADIPSSREYQDYCRRFESIEVKGDIGPAGFQIIEDQIFPVELKGHGEVSFIPAYDTQYRRLALFFAGQDGDKQPAQGQP